MFWHADCPCCFVQPPGWVATMVYLLAPAAFRASLNLVTRVVFSTKPGAPMMTATLPPFGSALTAMVPAVAPAASSFSSMTNFSFG